MSSASATPSNGPRHALVLGAGGFIGSHLVARLKRDGWWVRGVDIRRPAFGPSPADEFLLLDLREAANVEQAFAAPGRAAFDEVYQLAADMGGAGFVFTGENDAEILRNSGLINLNVSRQLPACRGARFFFSSSACIYPAALQADPRHPVCGEDAAYPAGPDSEYGWEKLYAERLYLACARNERIEVRIARFHNIFGPLGCYEGGREKAPAALCRKVAEAESGTAIDVWGDGLQSRSFLGIGECLEGVRRLMDSSWAEPLNIGSSELVTISDLAHAIIALSGKRLSLRHVPGPQGVRGRVSDNARCAAVLGWQPSRPLIDGLRETYRWIEGQVASRRALPAR